MAKILPIFHFVFLGLMILPGLESAKSQIKCHLCAVQCTSPTKEIWCNGTYTTGHVIIADTPKSTLDSGNEGNGDRNSIINLSRQAATQDTEYVCYKYITKDANNQDVVTKGCADESSVQQTCSHLDPSLCHVCKTDMCNAAGSIKITLAMIFVPVTILIFSRI
ncbi:uncharacterized protein [Prorops nasuta]|uniref:uncharacterized protein n=1 Tax=Prorops nasuta TaxID=863751 RepID=UPI0034CFF9A4